MVTKKKVEPKKEANIIINTEKPNKYKPSVPTHTIILNGTFDTKYDLNKLGIKRKLAAFKIDLFEDIQERKRYVKEIEIPEILRLDFWSRNPTDFWNLNYRYKQFSLIWDCYINKIMTKEELILKLEGLKNGR